MVLWRALLVLYSWPAASALRLTTTTTLKVPAVDARNALATPSNWPKFVLSSSSVEGENVDTPLRPGQSVSEVFGLPPLMPLYVKWECKQSSASKLDFFSPDGLAGVASNCRMEALASHRSDP